MPQLRGKIVLLLRETQRRSMVPCIGVLEVCSQFRAPAVFFCFFCFLFVCLFFFVFFFLSLNNPYSFANRPGSYSERLTYSDYIQWTGSGTDLSHTNFKYWLEITINSNQLTRQILVDTCGIDFVNANPRSLLFPFWYFLGGFVLEY
jgi:hypothetical protein